MGDDEETVLAAAAELELCQFEEARMAHYIKTETVFGDAFRDQTLFVDATLSKHYKAGGLLFCYVITFGLGIEAVLQFDHEKKCWYNGFRNNDKRFTLISSRLMRERASSALDFAVNALVLNVDRWVNLEIDAINETLSDASTSGIAMKFHEDLEFNLRELWKFKLGMK